MTRIAWIAAPCFLALGIGFSIYADWESDRELLKGMNTPPEVMWSWERPAPPFDYSAFGRKANIGCLWMMMTCLAGGTVGLTAKGLRRAWRKGRADAKSRK